MVTNDWCIEKVGLYSIFTNWEPLLTRIVRKSDYSPSSELCSMACKTMMGSNPKLDLVSVELYKKFSQILSLNLFSRY